MNESNIKAYLQRDVNLLTSRDQSPAVDKGKLVGYILVALYDTGYSTRTMTYDDENPLVRSSIIGETLRYVTDLWEGVGNDKMD